MDFARGGTMEGLGGPIRMDEVQYGGIDPTLDACCQREVCLFVCLYCVTVGVVCCYDS